jgi:hypothetical protein
MLIPDRVNTKWLGTLDDVAVVEAESDLHADFNTKDAAEKVRRGTSYRLLQGPSTLVDAWMRWQLVNKETVRRGLVIRRRA